MENWNWEIDASKKVEQEIVKKLLNDEDSVHWRQKKLDNQELKNFLRTRRGVRVLWITFWVRFRNCRTRWIPRLIKEIFTTLKDRAALEHPTFPLDPWLFRVAAKNQAASLQCRMIHGTLRVFRETFLKAYLLEKDNPYLASKIRGTWHDLFAKRNKTIEWDDMRRVLQYRTRIKKRYKDLYSTLEDLLSSWCDGLSKVLDLGNASWTIPGLYGISELESQPQDWSMLKNSRSSSHVAVD